MEPFPPHPALSLRERVKEIEAINRAPKSVPEKMGVGKEAARKRKELTGQGVIR